MRKENPDVKRILTPTYMFAKFDDVTPEFLAEKGIRALLCDIDNTLAPYEEPDPNERVLAWFAQLSEHGIKASLVSNNHAERVERFNAPLGLPAYPDSKKPGKKTLLYAIEKMGVDKSECAMLGDQLLTDSYAGLHIGIPTLIVPPIRDKRNLFFRFKRWCERPFIRRYARENGWQEWMGFWKVKSKNGGKQI